MWGIGMYVYKQTYVYMCVCECSVYERVPQYTSMCILNSTPILTNFSFSLVLLSSDSFDVGLQVCLPKANAT